MSSDGSILRFKRRLAAVRSAGEPVPSEADARAVEDQRRRQAERSREMDQRLKQIQEMESALAREREAVERKTRELDEKLAKLASLMRSINREKTQMLEANEEEIVSFSLSITEKVLQHEIENGRYKISEVVRSALQAVKDRGSVVIRVNPRDHEMARAAVDRLARTFGNTRINTVPDESIPLASCCIETDSGKIFSEVPGRLKRIEERLLKHGGDLNGL